MKTRVLAWLAALTLIMVSACSRSDSDGAAGAASAGPVEKRYPIRGEVVSADVARRVLVVQHEEIPGYMPAMTMEFTVSAGDAASAKPGARIRAEMIPSDEGHFRLEKIWPDDTAVTAAVAAGAMALRQDTAIRSKKVYREVGEAMPEFALYDQEGRLVRAAQFRGRQIMLNFIFTRCPVATMCPAATAKMIATQKAARAAGVTGIEFISITLDPDYDTPGVLKEYAENTGIDTANFSLLTGPENAIRDLLAQFGILTELEGGLLKHTLATLLIDAKGKIIHRADGSLWEPNDFVAKMKP